MKLRITFPKTSLSNVLESLTKGSQLKIESGAFNGIGESLEELILEKCCIEEFPEEIGNLRNLKSLSLAKNRLLALKNTSLQHVDKLEKLRLEGNFIEKLDNGTFDSLKKTLKALSFGEGNFVTKSFLDELIKLTNLKLDQALSLENKTSNFQFQELDLRYAMDPYTIPDGSFKSLNNLETLNLIHLNFKKINKTTFTGLQKLKVLDLRINLIEQIECDSFKDIQNLEQLMLDGNYVTELKPCLWNGLKKLNELSIAWNNIEAINNSFSTMPSTLKILNIGNNKELSNIQPMAFDNLGSLEALNLGGTSIRNITKELFRGLSNLKILDLTSSAVEYLEPTAFENQKITLEKLKIQKTNIKRISSKILRSLQKLKELDLSNNKWICDDKMIPVVLGIMDKYSNATRNGQEFVLENPQETTCDRPYSKRGAIISSLNISTLVQYDETSDTTTTKTPLYSDTTTTSQQETTTLITLIPVCFI
uniref:LRRCT domain-containing protein n=1 Tax=Syphacia muris TaxID=451379 RepID=A0A0N5AZF6_9BILA